MASTWTSSQGGAGAGAPDRFAVARLLREIGWRLVLAEADRFRARAYERAAVSLEGRSFDLARFVADDRLTELPGVGPAIAAQIAEIHRTGRSGLLERLRADQPPGVLELSRVPGLNLRRIEALHEQLGIRSVEDLRAACEAGRVREARGFGAATERKLLEALDRRAASAARVLLHVAGDEAERLVAYLHENRAVLRVGVAGSLRRGAETVGNLDLVVATLKPSLVFEHLLRYPLAAESLERDGEHCAVRLARGLRVDLYATAGPRFVHVLHQRTGSAAHLDRLARLPGAQAAAAAAEPESEAEIYERLGLPFVAPEQREDQGEIEAALSGTLPTDLVRETDIRGLVHCHTVYSDGRATIEQMARAADALGMSYLTITDHSPTASYAGGLSVDRLRAQWDEIARVQERVQVRLFRGTECDILADGALDYPDDVLEQLDVVVASVHARHALDPARMTERLVRAMRHPRFKIWGHGLGRLLQRRPPIECDVPAVLDAAAESRAAAIEVNGDPHRLDLEPRWIRAARDRGLRFVISTDAHAPGELRNLRYGVLTARRGWVRAGEVLNTFGAEAFARAVRPRGGL
jgi:DNA polymerase (family 10)